MDTVNLIGVLPIGALAVVAFFIFFLLIREKGLKDKPIKSILANLSKEYKIFSNMVVSVQHGMSNIDFVVVSPYGLFVIDAIYEATKIFGDIGQREWQVGKKQTIYNPVWRNRTHLNGLEKILGNLPYISLVVFVNGTLKNNFGTNVVELSGMLPFIKQYRSQVLQPERIKKIINALEKIRLKR